MAKKEVVMRFMPGGAVRAIHDDDYDFAGAGFKPPTRASHVEPIQSGPCAGWWYADMSPLGEAFQFCLWPPCRRRDEALQAEHDFIVENWIRK